MTHLFHSRQTWFVAIFLFCAALVLANVIHFIVFRLLKQKQSLMLRTNLGLKRHLDAPARIIFLATCALIALHWAPLSADMVETIRQWLRMLLVVALGWLAIGFIYVMENALIRHFDVDVENNIRARRVRTQTQLFRRVLISFVVIVDAGCLLWTFHDPRIWQYGTGLIASAGLASLILATAAKSTASNFLAGFQIALTEPIRIDDVVVVQGEWGRIEEITSAYVVVKIWDLRRLIVPLSYFIEQPFQNWTRETTNLLGTAFLYVDYSVPVEPLRQRLKELLETSPLWDKQVWSLQVTNLTDHTMELRCLMSARNSSESFDLRCMVREQMMAYVQQHYPGSLPLTRNATLTGDVFPPTGGSMAGETASRPHSTGTLGTPELSGPASQLPPKLAGQPPVSR